MAPTNRTQFTTAEVKERLTELGQRNRNLGMALRPRKHGADQRLADAALGLVTGLYVDGVFGDEDREAKWLTAKADDLADELQGRFEDWIAEDGDAR